MLSYIQYMFLFVVLCFVISHIDYFFTIRLDKNFKLCLYGTCKGIKIQTEHFVLFSNTF